MKNTIKIGAISGTTMALLNLFDQYLIKKNQEFDFDELISTTLTGMGLGAATGLALDITSLALNVVRNNPEENTDNTLSKVDKVWEKGTPVYRLNPDKYRKDMSKNLIKRSEYGNRKSDYGWEIDHSKPKSKGGTEHLNNLQPLQWLENVKKGNQYPYKK